jgi:anaerobic selenocysteine-containing dehydrogenase
LKKEQEKLPVDKDEESGQVTRRDFLVGAGTVAVGGAIGAGLLSSCKGDTTTVTQTTTKTVPTTITTTVGGGTGPTVTVTIHCWGRCNCYTTKTITQSGGLLPCR